jgi:hypothetical protein
VSVYLSLLLGLCALGPRDVVDVMQNVNEFLDKNPTETIIFIYEVNNGVDQTVDLNRFYDRMLLVDGLVEKLYVHDGRDSPWPTLRQLKESSFNKVNNAFPSLKKYQLLFFFALHVVFSTATSIFFRRLVFLQRIIMFHYNGPNCNTDPGSCPDGLHQYYNYASDNDWDHSNVESIEDTINSCELRKNGINSNVFVGLNNFVSPPTRKAAKELNAYSAATEYVDTCAAFLGTDINFLLVDFWSEGELPRFTQDHNAAKARRRRERKLLRSERTSVSIDNHSYRC